MYPKQSITNVIKTTNIGCECLIMYRSLWIFKWRLFYSLWSLSDNHCCKQKSVLLLLVISTSFICSLYILTKSSLAHFLSFQIESSVDHLIEAFLHSRSLFEITKWMLIRAANCGKLLCKSNCVEITQTAPHFADYTAFATFACFTLHGTSALYYIALHVCGLHYNCYICSAFDYITLHCTVLHCTALYYTAHHFGGLHYI